VPIQPCPKCQNLVPRWLEAPSTIAAVNYYRCPVCGHVWTISKDGDGTITHITPMPEKTR
jgi:hypothetical protein